jgi:hypothetical protein
LPDPATKSTALTGSMATACSLMALTEAGPYL